MSRNGKHLVWLNMEAAKGGRHGHQSHHTPVPWFTPPTHTHCGEDTGEAALGSWEPCAANNR